MLTNDYKDLTKIEIFKMLFSNRRKFEDVAEKELIEEITGDKEQVGRGTGPNEEILF